MTRDELDPRQEEIRHAHRWAGAPGTRAGIFLLDGGYHVAVPGSPMEGKLREDGALLVAMVAFDGSHADRPPHRLTADVRLLSAREAAELGGAQARN